MQAIQLAPIHSAATPSLRSGGMKRVYLVPARGVVSTVRASGYEGFPCRRSSAMP